MEDRKSRIAWQTINEGSRRKSTTKAKLKAVNQQERIKLWKRHFEKLLRNPPKVTHEPITRIISKQLDIKLGPFTRSRGVRTIGRSGERGSGISMLAAQHDDDDMGKCDYLIFPFMLVYHRCTNANIDPGRVGTWLNVFPSSKQRIIFNLPIPRIFSFMQWLKMW